MKNTYRFLLLTVVLIGSLVLPAARGAEKFTIAVIPDTQQETLVAPERFDGRMQWLADNQSTLNLQMVLQVGDMMNWDTPDHIQFVRGSSGMEILDKAHIPYAIAVGNHDTAAVKEGGSAAPGTTNTNLRITTTYNSYFPSTRFARLGGMFQAGKMDNAFHMFSAGGLDWMVINLELWPRTEVLDWAKIVVQEHPKHNVIILTHSHLSSKSTIEQGNGGYGDNGPQYVFDNLLKLYPNVKMVFSGHTGTHGYRTDKGVEGNTIYQFLQCYHDGTANPTRLLEIDPDNGTLKTHVYCPSSGKDKADGSAFTVTDVKWVAKN